MALTWERDEQPVWDADKQRVIGSAPAGTFVIPFHDGDPLPAEWFVVRDGDGGTVVGYGRLDIGWGGDAEILLAVDPARQERGIGSFVLARLADEAASRGINYVYNTIGQHDGRELVHDWLVVRGFRGGLDTDLRKRVGSSPARTSDRPARDPGPGAPAYDASTFDAAQSDDLAPGREEQGGYVDVDEHRY
jgi:GNAT superfamily N-acetyltransferase